MNTDNFDATPTVRRLFQTHARTPRAPTADPTTWHATATALPNCIDVSKAHSPSLFPPSTAPRVRVSACEVVILCDADIAEQFRSAFASVGGWGRAVPLFERTLPNVNGGSAPFVR